MLVQLLIANQVSSQVLSETIQHLTRQVMCVVFVWSGYDFPYYAGKKVLLRGLRWSTTYM